jgi:hypothetical protein
MVFLPIEVEVGQKTHVNLEHHRFPGNQESQQGLLCFAAAGRGVRLNRNTGALAGDLFHAGLGNVTPAEEGRLAFEVKVAEADTAADSEQHVFADGVTMESVDMAHRAGDAVMGGEVLEAWYGIERHVR